MVSSKFTLHTDIFYTFFTIKIYSINKQQNSSTNKRYTMQRNQYTTLSNNNVIWCKKTTSQQISKARQIVSLLNFRISKRLFYSNASMNSFALKGIKSSIFSPTPTYTTGSPNSSLIASTTPPFAVPSSFVRMMPSVSMSSLKICA